MRCKRCQKWRQMVPKMAAIVPEMSVVRGKIVARCAAASGFGAPDRRALLNFQNSRHLSPFSRWLRYRHSQRLIHFAAVQSYPHVPFAPKAPLLPLAAPPQRRARYTNNLFSETSHSPWLQLSSPQTTKESFLQIVSQNSSISTVIVFRRAASTRT